jgi:hypothetical protein
MGPFKFVDSILGGRAIELYNFGYLRREYIFVDDVVEEIVPLLPLLPRDGKAGGRGSLAPSRLGNIGNQLPVELLHVVRITKGFCRRFSIEEGVQRFVYWYVNEYVPLVWRICFSATTGRRAHLSRCLFSCFQWLS